MTTLRKQRYQAHFAQDKILDEYLGFDIREVVPGRILATLFPTVVLGTFETLWEARKAVHEYWYGN